MKSIYFLATKLKVYIIELPLIALLVFAIIYNKHSKELLKFYPLQIALSLGIVFIFIYFLRLVRLNTDEVRCIGLFSSKDRASLKKGRRLVLTLRKGRKLRIEVFAKGEAPLLDWVNPEDYTDSEINVFRTKAVGGAGSAKKLLKYFDIPSDDFEEILNSESFEKEYEAINLTSKLSENGQEISLKFTETL